MTRPDIKMPDAIVVSGDDADPRLAAVLHLSSLKPSVPRRRTVNACAAMRQPHLPR